MNLEEGSFRNADQRSIERALQAAASATHAAAAAAWTVEDAVRGWAHDPAEAEARAGAGPEYDALEAERCTRLALRE